MTCAIRVAVDLAFDHENKHTLSSTLHLSFDMILTATFCSVQRRAHGRQHSYLAFGRREHEGWE
jgi:hypothetical protein